MSTRMEKREQRRLLEKRTESYSESLDEARNALLSQLTLLKNPTMTAVLTLSSGLRNIWNAPAVAPHGSLTLSTTFLLPVTAVSITASVSLPDVLSPALKLPVYARAGGFPMVIDRLRVDRRLYNTNRICQLEFNPVDAPCFGVIVLIHRCVKALFSESKGGGVYWIYSSGNGTTRNPK